MNNQLLKINDYDQDDDQYDRSLSKEAQRVVKEINFGVEIANVSSVLENNDSIAYINIKTLEKEDWCIELTASGYLIVSNVFDKIDDNLKEKNLKDFCKYETIESLMHKISPMFVIKFNNSVAEKLKEIS